MIIKYLLGVTRLTKPSLVEVGCEIAMKVLGGDAPAGLVHPIGEGVSRGSGGGANHHFSDWMARNMLGAIKVF